jgi:hypothetical protein
MRRPAPRLRHDLAGDQEPQLDADAGKADPFAALLAARRDVVVPGQLSPLHAATVIDDGQRRSNGIGHQPHARGAGVERIGNRLGEDGLLE